LHQSRVVKSPVPFTTNPATDDQRLTTSD